MTEHWDGTERRRDPGDPVTRSEVRSLRAGVEGLTHAFQIRTDDIDKLLKRIASMFIALFVVQFLVGLWFVAGLRHDIEDRHDKIICLQELTVEAKTLLGNKACP